MIIKVRVIKDDIEFDPDIENFDLESKLQQQKEIGFQPSSDDYGILMVNSKDIEKVFITPNNEDIRIYMRGDTNFNIFYIADYTEELVNKLTSLFHE